MNTTAAANAFNHEPAIDIVWLKKDVRLGDHGPFHEVSKSHRPFAVLYLFEPDQLREKTVHGSHLLFGYEGVLDLERQLIGGRDGRQQQCITICHNTAVGTLEAIRQTRRIARLLAHEETGHWQSYMRDRAVRKWCRSHSIPFVEFNQTGVTRCLANRDDFSTKFHGWVAQPMYPSPNVEALGERLVHLPHLPGTMVLFRDQKVDHRLDLNIFHSEIPEEQRRDRPERQQQGGEAKALATLDSFLQERGSKYTQDISSPNTSWNSCSRLSPYLTWGHISLRQVFKTLQQRQHTLRRLQAQGRNVGTWLKSLQAFSSRLHWRSHFIQKLETEPQLERQDLCPAFQHVRRQPGDWNEDYYRAWKTGTTGFPFVDACMRCLLLHGWINFRMRAMLVSFATYNLFLDWKGISYHLARVFLDYEPGIHYPQLQMQAGTTGINAMRVYNVTKQGKDQDPRGKFIRRYVPELSNVLDQFIHEPWKMTHRAQQKCTTLVHARGLEPIGLEDGWSWYPEPIVNEEESAKTAKAKMAAIRNQQTTKVLAKKVYVKHGSRSRASSEMNGRTAMVAQVEDQKGGVKQLRINDLFSKSVNSSCDHGDKNGKRRASQPTLNASGKIVKLSPSTTSGWDCVVCTFRNDNAHGLVCAMCQTKK